MAKGSVDMVRETLDAQLPAATAAAVRASLHTAFASAFTTSVVPAFEAAVRDMFTQVRAPLPCSSWTI